MKLLLKRNQTAGQIAKVKFQLWGKVELDEAEGEIVKRYNFDNAILIAAVQPTLIRNSVLIAAGVGVVVFGLLMSGMASSVAFLLAVIVGGGGGYFYFHQKRETIYVRDMIHGRYFTCSSVIDLARKEAWLDRVAYYLRQVMESAKHWDGTETIDIAALPKDEAKLAILKGL
jgi:hypothetical protein